MLKISFLQILKTVEFSGELTCLDTNYAWIHFRNIFTNVLNTIAPTKSIRIKQRSASWINSTVWTKNILIGDLITIHSPINGSHFQWSIFILNVPDLDYATKSSSCSQKDLQNIRVLYAKKELRRGADPFLVICATTGHILNVLDPSQMNNMIN